MLSSRCRQLRLWQGVIVLSKRWGLDHHCVVDIRVIAEMIEPRASDMMLDLKDCYANLRQALILKCVGTDEASHPQNATKYKKHAGADESTSQIKARKALPGKSYLPRQHWRQYCLMKHQN